MKSECCRVDTSKISTEQRFQCEGVVKNNICMGRNSRSGGSTKAKT